MPTEPIPSDSELHDLAVSLARGAGQVVRAGRSAHLSVTAKSSATDLVTEVDRASEEWLVGELAARRPDDAILGEEGGERPGRSGVRWVLDPIDGTVNFVLGLPQYSVSVAAELDGVVVAGAVYNPVSDEIFHARRGGGAFRGTDRLAGPRPIPLARAVVATGFAYDAAMRARQGEVAARLLPRVADVRRLGSAALDLCYLAAGWVDAYFEAGLNPWDQAAGGLVAAEAGCVASGLRGRPAGRSLYAAAGAQLAPEFFALLAELGADQVSS